MTTSTHILLLPIPLKQITFQSLFSVFSTVQNFIHKHILYEYAYLCIYTHRCKTMSVTSMCIFIHMCCLCTDTHYTSVTPISHLCTQSSRCLYLSDETVWGTFVEVCLRGHGIIILRSSILYLAAYAATGERERDWERERNREGACEREGGKERGVSIIIVLINTLFTKTQDTYLLISFQSSTCVREHAVLDIQYRYFRKLYLRIYIYMHGKMYWMYSSLSLYIYMYICIQTYIYK